MLSSGFVLFLWGKRNVKIKIGIILIITGSLLIASALGLLLYFETEQKNAAEAVEETLPKLASLVLENALTQQEAEQVPHGEDSEEKVLPEMDAVEIDGEMYIGFISMPTLGLELPILQDWSYNKLKTSPCRYFGSIFSDDLVLMAHNYRRHFKRIRELKIGDPVIFTDVHGRSIEYEVAASDVLGRRDVPEMTAGDYDLSLFTCTYGGKSRYTVRCNRVFAQGDEKMEALF